MIPRNLQNHGFHSERIQNPWFSCFLKTTPKSPGTPPGEAKWRPESLFKMLKNGPRTFLEAPRQNPVNFFGALEASRRPPGPIFIAPRKPSGIQGLPGGGQEGSWRSFWTMLDRILEYFGPHFGQVSYQFKLQQQKSKMLMAGQGTVAGRPKASGYAGPGLPGC